MTGQWRRDFKGTALKFQVAGFDDRRSGSWNVLEMVDASERSSLHWDRPSGGVVFYGIFWVSVIAPPGQARVVAFTSRLSSL
jgi:hypothetical protein